MQEGIGHPLITDINGINNKNNKNNFLNIVIRIFIWHLSIQTLQSDSQTGQIKQEYKRQVKKPISAFTINLQIKKN